MQTGRPYYDCGKMYVNNCTYIIQSLKLTITSSWLDLLLTNFS